MLIKGGNEYTQKDTAGIRVRKSYNKTSKRTLVGQVNENNFIFIVCSKEASLEDIKTIGKQLNCQTLFNLDGGAFSTLWLRKGTTGQGTNIVGGKKKVVDSFYFSSLEK